LEPSVANGCVGSPVCFGDVWQQDLFAQQADAHALWLGAFTNTQAGDVARADATIRVATSASEAVSLPNIA
jgi:hypothetical protein